MEKRYGFIYVDKDNEGKGTLARSQTHRFQTTPNLSGVIRTSYYHFPNDIQVLPSGREHPPKVLPYPPQDLNVVLRGYGKCLPAERLPKDLSLWQSLKTNHNICIYKL